MLSSQIKRLHFVTGPGIEPGLSFESKFQRYAADDNTLLQARRQLAGSRDARFNQKRDTIPERLGYILTHSLATSDTIGIAVDGRDNSRSHERLTNSFYWLARMQIPHRQLPTQTLKAVVQEFVSRDGTDHTSVAGRVVAVMQLLDDGCVELHFDDETKTCNIVNR